MVKYKLTSENKKQLIYYYYPEKNETLKPGVITVDKETNVPTVTVLAEKDWQRIISPEELNEMGKTINRMLAEQGDTDFVEMVTEPELFIAYGSHAVSSISEKLQNGIVPKEGIAAWY